MCFPNKKKMSKEVKILIFRSKILFPSVSLIDRHWKDHD